MIEIKSKKLNKTRIDEKKICFVSVVLGYIIDLPNTIRRTTNGFRAVMSLHFYFQRYFASVQNIHIITNK